MRTILSNTKNSLIILISLLIIIDKVNSGFLSGGGFVGSRHEALADGDSPSWKGGAPELTDAQRKANNDKMLKIHALRPTAKGGKCICNAVGPFCGHGGDPMSNEKDICSGSILFDCKVKGEAAIQVENCDTGHYSACNGGQNTDGSHYAACLKPVELGHDNGQGSPEHPNVYTGSAAV